MLSGGDGVVTCTDCAFIDGRVHIWEVIVQVFLLMLRLIPVTDETMLNKIYATFKRWRFKTICLLISLFIYGLRSSIIFFVLHHHAWKSVAHLIGSLGRSPAVHAPARNKKSYLNRHETLWRCENPTPFSPFFYVARSRDSKLIKWFAHPSAPLFPFNPPTTNSHSPSRQAVRKKTGDLCLKGHSFLQGTPKK